MLQQEPHELSYQYQAQVNLFMYKTVRDSKSTIYSHITFYVSLQPFISIVQEKPYREYIYQHLR